MPTIDKRTNSPSGDGTLDSILKGKAIVQQRLEGHANPDFFTKTLTDDDYIRISKEGTEDIEPRTIAGTAKDVLVTAAKGVVGLGEAAVGLADIPTFGRVGKAMEDYLGYDAGATQKVLEGFYSEPQKAAFSEVEKAQGFFDTAKSMLQHPSTIAHALVESGPQMLGSAGMARKLIATGMLKASPVWQGILSAAIGEGVVSAGAAAEGIRTQTDDGLLTAKQALSAVGSGFGTGAFAIAGGRVAKKLGIGDIDVFLGGGSTASAKGVIKRIIGGGISEGAFEELPQSMQEQVWLNAAMDKPLLDGVAEAGAAGLITGVVMGGGFGAVMGRVEPEKKETAKDVLLNEGEKDATAKDVLMDEPVVSVPEPTAAETLAAEEAAAAFTEEELEAAAVPEEKPPTPPAEEPVAAPTWVDNLTDETLISRMDNLKKTEKEIGLSEKQAKNLELLQQEQVDRGITPAAKKEVPRDVEEEKRMARAEKERVVAKEKIEEEKLPEREEARIKDHLKTTFGISDREATGLVEEAKKKGAKDAERIRREAEEAGERKRLERKEKERIRLRDVEKDRVEAEKKKADEAKRVEAEKIEAEKVKVEKIKTEEVREAKIEKAKERAPDKIPVEYVGMQEKVGEPSFPIVTELDEGKSTVTFDPGKHEIAIGVEEHAKAVKAEGIPEEVPTEYEKLPAQQKVVFDKAEPVVDLRKEETGWGMVEDDGLYGIINKGTGEIRYFKSKDPKKAAENLRASALAQDYAIEHRTIEKVAEPEPPKKPAKPEPEPAPAKVLEPAVEEAISVEGIPEYAEKVPEKVDLPGAEIVTEPSVEKEAAPAKMEIPELEGIDLSKVTVETRAIREATGETIMVKEKADVALKEVDKDIETYYELLACIE